MSSAKEQLLLIVSFSSLLPHPAQAALPSEKLEKGSGGAKEGKRREGKKLIILHSQSMGNVKEREWSQLGFPSVCHAFQLFSCELLPPPRPPSPSCHSSAPPQSLFPFLSLFFFFSSLHLSTHFYLLFLFPPLLFSLIEISLMHFPSGFLLGYFVLFLSVPRSPFLSVPLVPEWNSRLPAGSGWQCCSLSQCQPFPHLCSFCPRAEGDLECSVGSARETDIKMRAKKEGKGN